MKSTLQMKMYLELHILKDNQLLVDKLYTKSIIIIGLNENSKLTLLSLISSILFKKISGESQIFWKNWSNNFNSASLLGSFLSLVSSFKLEMIFSSFGKVWSYVQWIFKYFDIKIPIVI